MHGSNPIRMNRGVGERLEHLTHFRCPCRYVAVSINYRLDGKLGLQTDVPCEDASDDAKAAIRFVRMMNESWRVDPSRVMIGGDSAGAVTSLVSEVGPNSS